MKVEFTDGQRRGKVVAGVDTHSKTHWLCVLGEHESAGLDGLARRLVEDGLITRGEHRHYDKQHGRPHRA